MRHINTPSLEQEVKSFLASKGAAYRDNSSSYKELDFTLLLNNRPYFYLEVKEKRQKYNMKNWPKFTEESDLFILDDLTVRKCLAYSPQSGILVRDNLNKIYFFFSVIDLALMPRQRLNRHIHRTVSDLKGKWLISFSCGVRTDSIEEAFSNIRRIIDATDRILFDVKECFGNYDNEEIASGGITRQPSHWNIDVESTR